MRIPTEKRKPLGIALAVAVILIIAVRWSLTQQAAARNATQVSGNGTMEADEAEIGAQRAARLVKFHVAEGQEVKRGQIIAELDTSELQAQLLQAQGSAEAAQARVEELLRGTRSEQLRRAEGQVAQARANVVGERRSLANAEKGYGRRTQLRQSLDAAEAQRDVAQAALRAAQAALAGAETGRHTAREEFGTTVQLRQARDAAEQQLKTAKASHRAASSQLQLLLSGARSEQILASEAQVGQTTAALAVARKDHANAASDLSRAHELHRGKALSDQLLEAAQVRADTAQARVVQAEQADRQARERLTELRNGARPEEIETARAAVEQAQAAVNGGQSAFDNAELAYKMRLGARGQLEIAQTQRQVAQAQLTSARSALAGAELAVRNARTAYNDALTEKQSVDTSLQRYQTALSQLTIAEAQLDEFEHGATPEQLNQARGQLRQARGVLELARVQKEQSVIRAPRDGVLSEHVARVGEVVTPGSTVARLVPLDDVYLTLYVPVTELGKVKIGQRAEIRIDTIDTYRGKIYPGRVIDISSTSEFTPRNVQTRDEREKLVFQVKVSVDNMSRELKPGMPADATIDLR
jgi:HlyD family secretion protein